MRPATVQCCLLALLGLVWGGCGDPPPPAPTHRAMPHGEAPGADTVAGSAFRLATDPAGVRHNLDLALFGKGVPRADPRDAIPAILAPTFAKAKTFEMHGQDPRVIVLRLGDEVHAYPIYILDRHELVNDVIDGRPVLVSWCPLCGSSVAYDRRVGERTLTFGVSGYLYRSDVLMYDHQTESFWSQLGLEAVAGPQTGTRLAVLPCSVMDFAALRKRHPEASVLSEEPELWAQGVYARSAYEGYADSRKIWFPVGPTNPTLHPKAQVIGLTRGRITRAYELKALRARDRPLTDRFGDEVLTLRYDKQADEVTVRDAADTDVRSVRLFWFAWFAFHPDTSVWRGEDVGD